MNDRPGNEGGEIEPAVDNGRQLELFGELVKIEHRRLDEQNKRTDLAHRVLDFLDQKDLRQAEFAAKQLEANERADVRRYNLASRIIWVATVLIVATLVVSIASMLLGTPEQSTVAAALLKYAATAAGGAGVGYAALVAVRRLLRH